ncbi:MAG: amidohydrolase family protein [Anaeromyxobacteraceae bacterium]
MARLVVRNALLPPHGPGTTLVVEGRRIAAVAPAGTAVPSLPGDWEVDADGRLVVAGLVDAHTNLAFGALLRRAGLPGRPPATVADLRAGLRDRLAARATPAQLTALSRAGALAALRAGTTTALDLVSGPPGAGVAALEAVARGVAPVGLRTVHAYAARGPRGEPPRRADVADGAAFARSRGADARQLGAVGLGGLSGVDPDVLDELAAHAAEHGLLASVAEDEADLAHVFSRFSRRPLDLLAGHGLLGPRAVVAHAGTSIHSEAAALATTGATLALTPRAAAYWGAPLPPVLAFATMGVSVALGTDGLLPDVAGEALAAALWLRQAERSAAAAAGLVGGLAWPAAARLASELVGDTVGAIETGALADLVVLEWRPSAPPPPAIAPGDLALLWAGAPAAWVIVDGEVRLREGRLLGEDEARIAAEASAAAEALLAS